MNASSTKPVPAHSAIRRFRDAAVILALDWTRMQVRLCVDRLFPAAGRGWTRVRNRMDRFVAAPDGPGVACDWRWSRDLAVCREIPGVARQLLRHASRFHPVEMRDELPETARDPEVTFVIGHRGRDRLPQLLATLRSLAGQADVSCEVIVVEQSSERVLANELPVWVRLIETPVAPGTPYNRSAAFNAGARAARGSVLVLHDNDIVVPRDYAMRILRRADEGYEVIDLKRFIFYLDEPGTRAVLDAGAFGGPLCMERVMQNSPGGGTLAVARRAYFEIGGFDEAFVGWGGEDEEFWNRAQSRRVWPYGELPVIHLWHAPQPLKQSAANPTRALLQERLSVSTERRISELALRNFSIATKFVPDLASVVIPVFNRAASLGQAVASALEQSHRPIEILIVDDGSTDDTPAVAAALAASNPGFVRVLRQENGGPGRARETGRLAARGEFVQYLDSDDVLLPGKFEAQVRGLREHPDCGVSYGVTRLRRADGTLVSGPLKRTGERMERLFPAALQDRWWSTLTPLWRREVTDAVGPWMTLRLHEDWEYDCRVAALGVRLHYVADEVAEVREDAATRLSRGGRFDPARLHDRACAYERIFHHARAAGVARDLPEMRHFSRALFLVSRECGVAGLARDAWRLLELSRLAAGGTGGAGHHLVGACARILGWRVVGRIAQVLEKVRDWRRGPTGGEPGGERRGERGGKR